MVNEAKNEAERKIKESKQKAFRQFRDRIASVEKEAEAKAEKSVEAGRKNAESLSKEYEKKVQGTAKWISEEVISRYGRG